MYLGFFDKHGCTYWRLNKIWRIVNTFRVTHSTNEDLLNIKRKGDPEVSYPLVRPIPLKPGTTGTWFIPKYMPPPLPYFKVNIYPFPLPHFASIFFAYLWSFRWPNYIVTFPRYFSFRLPQGCYAVQIWPGDIDLWPMTLKINRVPDSPND